MASAWGSSWASAWGNSWGSIASATVTPDTHDGGYTRKEWDQLRKRIREADKSREESRQAQERAKRKLVEELDRSWRRVVDKEPEIAAEIAVAAREAEPQAITATATLPDIDFRKFADILDTAGLILSILDKQRQADEWQAADEEDVEILLIC